MKTQLIMLDTPIIVSDGDVLKGDLYYKSDLLGIFQAEYALNKKYPKVIGSIHKYPSAIDLPSIDWNGLENEFGWIDVEKLANQAYQPEPSSISEYAKDLARPKRKAFINGFKKAQSLNEKKFSLKDMEKSIEMTIELMRNKYTEFRTHKNTILQSLQQPKVFDIEVETEVFTETIGTSEFDFMEQDSLRFKITNNSIKIIRKL